MPAEHRLSIRMCGIRTYFLWPQTPIPYRTIHRSVVHDLLGIDGNVPSVWGFCCCCCCCSFKWPHTHNGQHCTALPARSCTSVLRICGEKKYVWLGQWMGDGWISIFKAANKCFPHDFHRADWPDEPMSSSPRARLQLGCGGWVTVQFRMAAVIATLGSSESFNCETPTRLPPLSNDRCGTQ